jgi:hypothetical protein
LALLPDFLTHSKGRLLLVFDKQAIAHFAKAQQCATAVGMMQDLHHTEEK